MANLVVDVNQDARGLDCLLQSVSHDPRGEGGAVEITLP